MALIGPLLTSTIPQADLGSPLTALAMAGGGGATVLVGLLGRSLAMTGRKQSAAFAARELTADARAPVLYAASPTEQYAKVLFRWRAG